MLIKDIDTAIKWFEQRKIQSKAFTDGDGYCTYDNLIRWLTELKDYRANFEKRIEKCTKELDAIANHSVEEYTSMLKTRLEIAEGLLEYENLTTEYLARLEVAEKQDNENKART